MIGNNSRASSEIWKKRAFSELTFIIELRGRLPVYTQIELPCDKVRYTDFGVPRNLARLAPSLTGLIGIARPDQATCNWVYREHANGGGRDSIFRSLSGPPPPGDTYRASALENGKRPRDRRSIGLRRKGSLYMHVYCASSVSRSRPKIVAHSRNSAEWYRRWIFWPLFSIWR